MSSTFSPLKIELITTGEQSGTWGDTTNTNLGTAIEEAIVGSALVTFASADVTLTLTNANTTQTARNMRLELTGTSGGARNLFVPAIEKPYIIANGLADAVTVKNSSGVGVAVPAGKSMWVYNNGTDVVNVVSHLTTLSLGTALPVSSGGTGSTSTAYCSLTTNVTGTLPIANGGTGSTSTTYCSLTTNVSGVLPNANTTAASANGASTIVARDASGNFSAGTITASLTGSASSVANALTVGTGLKLSAGLTYNGSAAVTINAVGTTLNSQTSAYVLVAGDAGKMVSITTGGVTVNNSVMSAGDIVTIYNNSASSQTITQGAGVTLQWAGQTASTTGTRTLGLYGIATIVFLSASSAVITGSGLT